ncbi:MAG: hypothetical protein KBC57_03355 [Neisseriaceae bacterium]|nr:hypothetical protein [Neisseriaceae bacterium]
MQKLLTSLAIISLLAGCSDKLEEAAKQAVKNNMVEPETAVFKNLKKGKTEEGEPVICGEVTSTEKNSGTSRFIYPKDAPKAIFEQEDAAGIVFQIVWLNMCEGTPLDELLDESK